jgi:hypothetical protein
MSVCVLEGFVSEVSVRACARVRVTNLSDDVQSTTLPRCLGVDLQIHCNLAPPVSSLTGVRLGSGREDLGRSRHQDFALLFSPLPVCVCVCVCVCVRARLCVCAWWCNGG